MERDERLTRLGTARREGAEQERKKFAARDKKIAEFLQSIGVSKKNIVTALAFK